MIAFAHEAAVNSPRAITHAVAKNGAPSRALPLARATAALRRLARMWVEAQVHKIGF